MGSASRMRGLAAWPGVWVAAERRTPRMSQGEPAHVSNVSRPRNRTVTEKQEKEMGFTGLMSTGWAMAPKPPLARKGKGPATPRAASPEIWRLLLAPQDPAGR